MVPILEEFITSRPKSQKQECMHPSERVKINNGQTTQNLGGSKPKVKRPKGRSKRGKKESQVYGSPFHLFYFKMFYLMQAS